MEVKMTKFKTLESAIEVANTIQGPHFNKYQVRGDHHFTKVVEFVNKNGKPYFVVQLGDCGTYV